jgi:hypothetical protein
MKAVNLGVDILYQKNQKFTTFHVLVPMERKLDILTLLVLSRFDPAIPSGRSLEMYLEFGNVITP